jgi:preprotein translocase subunit YajC
MKPGDKVQLISGGIYMTVKWVEDGYAAVAYWNDSKSQISEQKIEVAALKIITD